MAKSEKGLEQLSSTTFKLPTTMLGFLAQNCLLHESL
jgi:hypothetical protein